MKFASTAIPMPVPVLLTGAGSVHNLAENIQARGLKHAMIVTDKVLMEIKLVDSLLEALTQQGLRYTVFDNVQPNPTIQNIEDGRLCYKNNGCDSIIAFGGGSPMDCAKGIGARVGNPMLSVRNMKGMFRVVLPIPPFFCVPTTAGTGSEATIAAVISDPATHEKFIITDLKLVPKIAVLDPELMVGLPPHITAATGMDALTHAIEAYIGLNGSDFTNENALSATALVFENLATAYKDGKNLEARKNMAVASYKAGAAFTRAYVGYVHAVAHNMGGMYGVPHGLANAIILPYVLEFCQVEAQDKIADLARVAGLAKTGDTSAQLATKFINKIKAMNKAMKIPTFIKELKKEDIPLIAKRALQEAHPAYPVPRIMTLAECEALITRLLP